MATKVKVTCGNCSNAFELYKESFPNEPVKCPYCKRQMDEHMFGRIKEVLWAVNDVNYHFHKYHGERNEPLFTFDILYTHVPPEKF